MKTIFPSPVFLLLGCLIVGGCASNELFTGETIYLVPEKMPPASDTGRKAAGRKATARKAAERKAAKRKAAESKAAESKAAERKVAERKVAEKKVTERKAADRKATGRKTAGRKTAGRKTAGRKTAGRKTAGSGADSSGAAGSRATFVSAVTPPKRDFRATISATLRGQILALDPEHISGRNIERVLSKAPAPQVININGGIFPVHLVMKDFARFLAAMGYPRESTHLPGGEYSYSCYKPSDQIAGAAAWYYERSELPVIMVGHSQGGLQVVKVLHDLAGTFGDGLPNYAWNPETRRFEDSTRFWDARRGQKVPMVDLKPVFFATVVASGGATRAMPNQLAVGDLAKKIPDSTRYFTGYFLPGDILGGGIGGLSRGNVYRSTGSAKVRNVMVGWGSEHFTAPRSRHLAKHPASRAWIQNYHPSQGDLLPENYLGPTNNLLWAANVWYEIKKHWCLILQESARRG